MASENDAIVPRVMMALREMGAKAVKIHVDGYTEEGTPDILGCYRGRAFAFEVKNEIGEVSAKQAYELRKWAAAGAVTAVIRSPIEAIQLLQGIDHD